MHVQVKPSHIRRGKIAGINPVELAFDEHCHGAVGIAFMADAEGIKIGDAKSIPQTIPIKRVSNWIRRYNAGKPVKPFGFDIPDHRLTAVDGRQFPKSDHPIKRIRRINVNGKLHA